MGLPCTGTQARQDLMHDPVIVPPAALVSHDRRRSCVDRTRDPIAPVPARAEGAAILYRLIPPDHQHPVLTSMFLFKFEACPQKEACLSNPDLSYSGNNFFYPGYSRLHYSLSPTTFWQPLAITSLLFQPSFSAPRPPCVVQPTAVCSCMEFPPRKTVIQSENNNPFSSSAADRGLESSSKSAKGFTVSHLGEL